LLKGWTPGSPKEKSRLKKSDGVAESRRQSDYAGKTGTTRVVVEVVVERARYRGVVRVTGAIRRQPLVPSFLNTPGVVSWFASQQQEEQFVTIAAPGDVLV